VASLRHPNIVSVHAMGFTETYAYLAMAFLEGGDLKTRSLEGVLFRRKNGGYYQTSRRCLAHAHGAGVLHRDIKPSNILLNAAGEPLLADFGLAGPLAGAGDLTKPGQIAGTAAYLAPELLQGADHASPASDLYALGRFSTSGLTGRPPFVGDSSASILAQIPATEPAPPRVLWPEIPKDLETICLKCLEKMPDRRYESAQALKADLERFSRGEPVNARPVGAIEKRPRWRGVIRARDFNGFGSGFTFDPRDWRSWMAIRVDRARRSAEAPASLLNRPSFGGHRGCNQQGNPPVPAERPAAQASPDNQQDRDLKLRTGAGPRGQ